jgi:hypothetical protein
MLDLALFFCYHDLVYLMLGRTLSSNLVVVCCQKVESSFHRDYERLGC